MEKMLYKFSVDQLHWYKLGFKGKLDAIDLMLFSAIYKWFNDEDLHHQIAGVTYILVTLSFVQQQCPILCINNRETFRKRMLRLADAGLIERYENNQTENTSLYRRGRLFNCFDRDVNENERANKNCDVTTNIVTPANKCCNNNNISYNNIPLVTKVTSPKGDDSDKEPELFGENEVEQVTYVKKKFDEMEIFEDVWNLYGKKVERERAERYWKQLSKSDKAEVVEFVKKYVEATPDKQYRMNLTTLLNPANKRWKDEIINRNDNGSNAGNKILTTDYARINKLADAMEHFFNT